MIDIEKLLYDKIKTEISKWDEEGIYAISFFVNSNEAYEYKNYKNVSTFAISYNTETDCKGAGPLDEERWNYAFWRQDETYIIDIDQPDECTEALYKWYAEQGIENIGFEDTKDMYDEEFNYIGRGPIGHYELIGIAANVAKKLQEEGFVAKRFQRAIPIIIHGLEYAWYDIEATKKANPNGEADTFIEAMNNNGANFDEVFSERKYPFSLFLTGFITNVLFYFFWLFIPSIILLIVGIWIDWCLYAGLALLVIDIILSLVDQIKIRNTMLSDSESEQFREFQDVISKDGNVFENIKNFVEDSAEEYVDNDEH